MLEMNLVLFIAISWYTFQDCQSEVCAKYESSDVHDDCEELRIENGETCYTKLNVSGQQRLEAKIKCREGFELRGISTRKCTSIRNEAHTSWDDQETKCIPVDVSPSTSAASISILDASRTSTTTSTKTIAASKTTFLRSMSTITSTSSGIVTSQDTRSAKAGNKSIVANGRLVLKVTIATAVSILVILLIVTLVRWIRKTVGAKSKSSQNNEVLMATNDTNDGAVFGTDTVSLQVDVAENNSSGYVDVLDRTVDYSTAHVDERRTDNNPNYDRNLIHTDMYDVATTSFKSNVQRTADTYSHLKNTKPVDNRPGLNYETGNIFHSLKDDSQCLEKNEVDKYCNSIQIVNQGVEMNEDGMDSHYDRTNIRPTEPRIDIDTYAHVPKIM